MRGFVLERNQLGSGGTPEGQMAKDGTDWEERIEPGQGLEMQCYNKAKRGTFQQELHKIMLRWSRRRIAVPLL